MAGQGAERGGRVGHHDGGQPDRTLGQYGGGPGPDRLRRVVVAVDVLAGHRDEQAAGVDLAAVDAGRDR